MILWAMDLSANQSQNINFGHKIKSSLILKIFMTEISIPLRIYFMFSKVVLS